MKKEIKVGDTVVMYNGVWASVEEINGECFYGLDQDGGEKEYLIENIARIERIG